MKTAEQWRDEFDHMKTTMVHPSFFEQGVIEKIQADAWKAGLTIAAEHADAYHQSTSNPSAKNIAALIRDDIIATRDHTTKPF